MAMASETHATTEPVWSSFANAEMLQAIGTVITHWAHLEALIEDLIAGFMSAELTHVYIMTANIKHLHPATGSSRAG
jgi:hypothetical protein